MKLNYKFKVCLMAFAFIFIGSTAIATNNLKTEITSESSDSWELVKEENGIQISFLEFNEDGKSYLKIKFENGSSDSLKFEWRLNKGAEIIVINSTSLEIKSLGIEIKKVFIPKEILGDLSITMNFK